ncbi:protein jag [Stomatohabitans albus]|uniref:Jag family protein n=1 Tax=Stomatohabitans albus TaxID=3110766 RepID=UPI00300D22E8
MSNELSIEDLDHDADVAADFLEGLLDAMDLDGDLTIDVTETEALISIEDADDVLIGRRGEVLDAIQEVMRTAVQTKTQRYTRVRLDVNGYRKREHAALQERVREAIAEARETGKAVHLKPTNAYNRKLMHDVVHAVNGVTSHSEGEEPRRHVVVTLDSER